MTYEADVTQSHFQVPASCSWRADDGGDPEVWPWSPAKGNKGLELLAQVLQASISFCVSDGSPLIDVWEDGLSFVRVVTANEDRCDAARARGLDVHSRIKHRVPTLGQAGRKPVSLSLPLGPSLIRNSSWQRGHPPGSANCVFTYFPDCKKKVNFPFVAFWGPMGLQHKCIKRKEPGSQSYK